MIILKQCPKISIVAEENDIINGVKKYYISYCGRKYDVAPEFRQVEPVEEKKFLYGHLRSEYFEVENQLDAEWERFHKLFNPAPAPAPVPASGVGSKLEELLMKTIAEQSVESIVEMAKPMLEKHIIETFGVLPQIHEIKTPVGTKEVKGTVHEQFEKVCTLVNMDIPVFLSGAAGTGKNVICKQVAEALNLDFYFTNAVTQEFQLKGFIDANGTYHETQFYKAFTQGGLFFLDEMDGSIPETLIILNSAIANRYFDFPTGKVEAHPDFRIIAAGNTVGTGADIEYTGRFQLDASSLDRFALVTIDYSPAIEKAVTGGNEELCQFAREFREVTEKVGIRCLFTYRSMERITKLEELFDLSEVLKMSLTKGLSKDDIKIIVNEFKGTSKYLTALKSMI